ncbi:hypothetical protein [Actinoplanes subtropicus]|uniref:hypothetical protein n=1 Tax=Actinoplanes subtropicus TaxID=543632 RepID=UPI0012F909EF|nr:hypothetical protein [Actinoplanes subtropicus]
MRDVLPLDYVAAGDDLTNLALRLETHRAAANRTAWHWYPEHAEHPQESSERGYLLLLDATIVLADLNTDWLELTLDIAWRPELTVNAAVEVGCWCQPDHNVHQVRKERRSVASPQDLVDAFAAGAAMLLDVLESGPFEPSTWRTRTGLPNAPVAPRQ